MKLLKKRQVPDTLYCGQYCVAQAVGISLGKSFFAFGHQGITTGKELRQNMAKFGIRCGKAMDPSLSQPLPKYAFLGVLDIDEFTDSCMYPNRKIKYFHWVLKWDKKIHDPEGVYKPREKVITHVQKIYLDNPDQL